MCGGSAPAQDTYVQEKQAALMQQLEADWGARFKPIEEGIMNELANRDTVIKRNVYESGEAAQQSYEATAQQAERNMASYGTQMDETQKAAMERSDAIAGQGSVIGARNMARDSTTGRMEQQQNAMVNLGTGIQSSAISGLNTAAGMEANRNAQNSQIYAQNQSSTMSTIGSIAGMAAMMMMSSDKNTKTNIKDADTEQALKDIESIDLKHWDYKPGMSMGRPEKGHIGGMAQDMPDSMTSDDKTMVDVGDSVMTAIGAIQHLSKKVDKLEQEKSHGSE